MQQFVSDDEVLRCVPNGKHGAVTLDSIGGKLQGSMAMATCAWRVAPYPF
jgi:hypothetical protein